MLHAPAHGLGQLLVRVNEACDPKHLGDFVTVPYRYNVMKRPSFLTEHLANSFGSLATKQAKWTWGRCEFRVSPSSSWPFARSAVVLHHPDPEAHHLAKEVAHHPDPEVVHHPDLEAHRLRRHHRGRPECRRRHLAALTMFE